MNLARIKNHFVNWREWELNPIVVKELRQAVRSWAVTGMLLLFLIVLFVVSAIFLAFQSFDVDPDVRLGSTMFSVFAGILGVSSVFFIPLYVGVRLAAERQENNPDLFYISTLSPVRIILGKFLCGAYMAVLFFSACMPFMAFTNLLRGVDLPTVFFILFYLFLVVCTVTMVAIFLASIPVSRPFKILIALLGLAFSFYNIVRVLLFSFEFLHSGIGASMTERNFWAAAGTTVAISLAITGLFFVMSVALISPPSSNRGLPVRIYISVMWLLGGLLAIGWIFKSGSAAALAPWTISMYWLMFFALIVVVSNSDQLSQRVRRAVPQSPLKRILAFLFFNGAAGGLIWVAIMLGLTLLIFRIMVPLLPKIFATDRDWVTLPIMMFYSLDYALLGLFIHRKFFANSSPKIAGVLMVSLMAIWALMPSVILFFLNELSWKSVDRLELGNIFNVFSMNGDKRLYEHLYFALGWLGLMILLNAKWFVTQARNFQPPPKFVPPVIQ